MPYDGSVVNLLSAPDSCALVLLASFLFSLPATATPLQVRARSELSARVDEAPGGVVLRGSLASDGGQPIGAADIRVHLKGSEPRVSVTAADGSFEIVLSLPRNQEGGERLDPSLGWEAEFDGDANAGPARVSGLLEGARKPSSIRLEIEPRTLSLDDPPARARVSVRAGASSIGSVPVFLRVGEGAELVGATDSEGDVAFLLHPGALEQPGRLEVSARWAGDHRLGPARVDRDMHVLRPTRLTLRVAREGTLAAGRYRFSGRLSDDRGAVGGATIALGIQEEGSALDEAPASGAIAQTNPTGHFVFAVPTKDLSADEPSTVQAQVVYIPGDAVHAGATSPSTRLPVPGPPGVSARWYASVTMLALALLILIELLRTGGVRGWGVRTLWRSLVGSRAPLRAAPASAPQESPARGDWLSLALTDHRTGAALDGLDTSKCTLTCLTAGAEIASAESGVTWGPLVAGSYQLEIHVSGYLSQQVEFSVPHDGSLDPMSRSLVEVRGHVLLMFSRALRGLGVRFRWGTETPSEAMARCAAPVGEAHQALQVLHRDTEALWFADRPPSPSDAERADRLLAKVEGS